MQINWGSVALRLLDLSLFTAEEAFKIAKKITPIILEVTKAAVFVCVCVCVCVPTNPHT